jgi:hypothetical protein
LEAAMGGTAGADTRLIQRIPLASGAKHEEDGIQRLPIINTGPMAPQGVRFAQREQRLDALPQCVRNTPITAGVLSVVFHEQGSCRREFFPTEYQ